MNNDYTESDIAPKSKKSRGCMYGCVGLSIVALVLMLICGGGLGFLFVAYNSSVSSLAMISLTQQGKAAEAMEFTTEDFQANHSSGDLEQIFKDAGFDFAAKPKEPTPTEKETLPDGRIVLEYPYISSEGIDRVLVFKVKQEETNSLFPLVDEISFRDAP